MKVKYYLLLAAAMLMVSVSAFAQSSETPLKGDVNEDGVVDYADINAIIAIIKNNAETQTTYYWYVGTSQPSSVDTSNIKSSVTEIGWHNMDASASILNVGQCVVDSSSTWYVLIPTINNSAFTTVLSGGQNMTNGFNVSNTTINSQSYVVFTSKETSKRFKYDFSK